MKFQLIIYQLIYRILSYQNTVNVPNQKKFQTRQLDLFVLKIQVIWFYIGNEL